MLNAPVIKFLEDPKDYTALIIPCDYPDIAESLKTIREKKRFMALSLIVLGPPLVDLYLAGADECLVNITPESITRIRARTKRIKELWRLAFLDELTGAFKRNYLKEYLDDLITTSASFFLAILDLDFFKNINDTWGHPAGDRVLQELVTFLRSNLREEDLISRYGGEEFIIIGRGDGYHALDRARERWSHHEITISDTTINSTFSVGIASYEVNGVTAEELIEQADHALSRAKLAGRNRVLRASEEKIAPRIELGPITIYRDIEHLKNDLKKTNKYTVIEIESSQLCGTRERGAIWKHDWRIGLAAIPYRFRWGIDVYGLPERTYETNERDLNSLKNLIKHGLAKKHKIAIYTNRQEIIDYLERNGVD